MLCDTRMTVLPPPGDPRIQSKALLLEPLVTDRQDLVDQEMSGSRWIAAEKPSRMYIAARVILHWQVDEFAEFRKLDDLVVDGVRLASGQTERGRY